MVEIRLVDEFIAISIYRQREEREEREGREGGRGGKEGGK